MITITALLLILGMLLLSIGVYDALIGRLTGLIAVVGAFAYFLTIYSSGLLSQLRRMRHVLDPPPALVNVVELPRRILSQND